jgi:hypothetical protein
MTVNNERPHWPFYLLWVVLTLLCVLLAFFLNLVLMRIVTFFVGDFVYVDGVRHITEDYLYMYTFVPIVGFLTGALQYGLLRRYLPHMGWWVAMTMGGWLLGVFLDLIPGWLGWTSPLFTGGLAFVVLGLSIGAGQWLLLRRGLPRAGWWIGANVAGWGLLALILGDNSIGQLGLFLIGLLPACATAVVLALLMKQVQSAEPQGM